MLSSSVWRGASRWWFSTGLVLGGLTTAVVAVSLGSLLLRPLLPSVVEAVLVVLVLVVVLLNEVGVITLRLPQNARQVPEVIRDDGPRFGALQFGFEMGTGLRTFMTSGLPHVLLAGVLLTASLLEAAVAGLAFGAGRALMTLARHAHPSDVDWDAALASTEKVLRLVLTVGIVAILAVLLTGYRSSIL